MKVFAECLVLITSAVAASGQGQVFFSNLGHAALGGDPNAPVYMSDGVTKISGSQFMAELLAGPSMDNLASIAMTGFLTGNGAGYFNGLAVAIPTVPYGNTAWVQVDVWNTASGVTFGQAKSSGLPNSWWQSPVFTASTSTPDGGVPLPPGYLTGLGTSPVYLNSVPEPSALVLVGCGLVVALFRKGLTTR